MKSLPISAFAKALTVAAIAGLFAGTAAFADPITPTFSSFGTLAGATFGGTGIPNNSVAITTFSGVTLGLSATQRFANPPLTNDGAGTFFAQPGGDTPSAYAHWNFDFYASNASATNYELSLLWDTNPGVGTDQSLLFSSGSSLFAAGSLVQDSLNLGMGFIGGAFNPSADGEYSFVLLLKDATTHTEVARSAINVNVGTAVPDTTSTGMLSLLGLSTLVVGVLRRRKSVRG